MLLSKRWTAIFALLFIFCGAAWAQGTMTDEQVLEYAKQGAAEGKSRDELISELALRGRKRKEFILCILVARIPIKPQPLQMTSAAAIR